MPTNKIRMIGNTSVIHGLKQLDGCNNLHLCDGGEYLASDQLLVKTTPIETAATGVDSIESFLTNLPAEQRSKQIVIPIVGSGTTERHIATLFRDIDGNVTVFDSKLSEPTRFLTESDRPSSPVKNAIFGLFRSIFSGKYSQSIDMSQGDPYLQRCQFEGLGTQSYIDGQSCGFQVVGNIEIISELVANRQDVKRDTLMTAISEGESPVIRGIAKIDGITRENLSWLDKVKAWAPTGIAGQAARSCMLGFVIAGDKVGDLVNYISSKLVSLFATNNTTTQPEVPNEGFDVIDDFEFVGSDMSSTDLAPSLSSTAKLTTLLPEWEEKHQPQQNVSEVTGSEAVFTAIDEADLHLPASSMKM